MVPAIKLIVWMVFVVMVVGVAVSLAIALDQNRESTKAAERWAKGFFVGAVLFLFAALAVTFSAGQINAGNRGVVLRFGQVTGRTIEPGLYFVTPFVNSVETMDVQTHAFSEVAAAASKDLQDVSTEVTLNYALDPAKVGVVWATLRRDYLDRIVKPAILESVKASTAKYNAEELITRRPEVKATIEDSLRQRLAGHGILEETVSITNFAFSDTFTASIEAKVVAVQRALEAENKLLQVEVEARQAKQKAEGVAFAMIAEADGQKKAAIARAEGEAQAILTVATAQADANERVNRTLTDSVINYALVQKLGPDIKVMLLPTGQQFILDVNALAGK